VRVSVDKASAKLRASWEKAVERDRPKDAADALAALERLEPKEPRWPHRLGDALRRLGRGAEAEQAYERAARGYQAHGQLPRALAVAKVLVALNPSKQFLVEQLDPAPARALRDEVRPATVVVPEPEMLTGEDASDTAHVDVALVELGSANEMADIAAATAEDRSAREWAERHRIATMASTSLFADVPPEIHRHLAHSAKVQEHRAGDVLLRAGDPADALFILVQGTLRVDVAYRAASPVELSDGHVFGEACLLRAGRRSATVVAVTDATTLSIGTDVLREAAASDATTKQVLFHLLVQRLIAHFLQAAPLFASFDVQARAEIARLFEVRTAPAGTFVAKAGTTADGLYVPVEGRILAVTGEDPSRPTAGDELPLGHPFGMPSLIQRAPWPKTLAVREDATLLRLPAGKFGRFLTERVGALEMVADVASRGDMPWE
jgi:CRP-like cAMP-binding protein